MSTVTLSQPHCAMVSAEKPLGMASHALTQALPSLRRFFSMLDEFMTAFPLSSGSEDGRIISRRAASRHGGLSQSNPCHPERSEGPSLFLLPRHWGRIEEGEAATTISRGTRS